MKAVPGGEFAEQFHAELIAEGWSGDELLSRFKERQDQIRPAVETLLSVAEAAAEGTGEFASYKDVFGTEE